MTEIDIPARFWTVAYNGAQIPDADNDLARGANCQRFAYALLAEAGFRIPPFRSNELWEDEIYTWTPTTLEPFDLILFNRTADSWGAHVAVYVGDGRAIHLCKEEGQARIWSIEEFLALDRYAVLIGVKRVRSNGNRGADVSAISIIGSGGMAGRAQPRSRLLVPPGAGEEAGWQILVWN